MLQVYQSTGYVMDPHGAVGYLGLKEYLRQNPGQQGVFLETAHPVKFLEVVEPVLGIKIEYPEQIRAVIDRKKEAAFIRTYGELKEFLTS
jgi:threonine synthase